MTLLIAVLIDISYIVSAVIAGLIVLSVAGLFKHLVKKD